MVVLTTSQAEQDILRSYQLHANAYVIKPFDADQFTTAIRHIDDFFLALIRQPAIGAPAPAEGHQIATSLPPA